MVGLGAAAYSPAKYGILTEYLPHPKLVVANGWIEGLTVGSIILGTLLGGALISEKLSTQLLRIDIPQIDTGIDTAAGNRDHPDHRALHHRRDIQPLRAENRRRSQTGAQEPFLPGHRFRALPALLWSDKLGQISLATTTLFWGAGATLQFIVLKWAEVALGYTLAQSTIMQGITAVGIAVGAIVAAKIVPLHRAVNVLPVGIAMGLITISMIFVRDVYMAMVVMTVIGALAGFFVVPMNALLQHRGHILMGAGHSIAVQNFNENLSILTMLGVYSLLIKFNFSIYTVIVLFGLFVAVTMTLVRERHMLNLRTGPLPQIPSEMKH